MPATSDFSLFQYPDTLIDADAHSIPLIVIRGSSFSAWLETCPPETALLMKSQNFHAAPFSLLPLFSGNGLDAVYIGLPEKTGLYTFAAIVENLPRILPDAGERVFELAEHDLDVEEIQNACIGWSLAAYKFDRYKENAKTFPLLAWPDNANRKRVTALIRSIALIRNLINTPANDLGPQELCDAAAALADEFQADADFITGDALLEKNFPMIYHVGHGSERAPCLIDLNWGEDDAPRLTLVGKGVVFDTGGYDIKPSSAMLLMKKDMGGAAMALGLALMIMALDLPLRLRVLIPAVENSISGSAYRPGDVLISRAGLSVEIGNTDAEGRLVMADCLSLACADNPDLLIDFSTLTGAARSALGFDIPALYSNSAETGQALQDISFAVEDPLWRMPLWEPYRADIQSGIADLNNAGNNPAGSITAALFLQSFVTPGTDWVHIDHYAWEPAGKPGRPKGGADTGMRACLAYIEKRFSATENNA